MIKLEDSIQYTNVVSKRYIFKDSEIEMAISQFKDDITDAGGTLKGPFFYALENIPDEDKVLQVEFFMPINEEHIKSDNHLFMHSYYSIENMISTCLFEEFERDTEIAYTQLLIYMDEQRLRQITPIFHVFSRDKSFPYVRFKIGVVEETNESAFK